MQYYNGTSHPPLSVYIARLEDLYIVSRNSDGRYDPIIFQLWPFIHSYDPGVSAELWRGQTDDAPGSCQVQESGPGKVPFIAEYICAAYK